LHLSGETLIRREGKRNRRKKMQMPLEKEEQPGTTRGKIMTKLLSKVKKGTKARGKKIVGLIQRKLKKGEE